MEIQELIAQARSVDGVPFSDLRLPFDSLGDLLVSRATESPDKIWLIYYDEDGSRREFSYGEFLQLVERTATFLVDHGISRGDRIATVAFNHTDTVIQYFAAWWIGATVVPINAGEDDDRIAYILSNSLSTLVFVRDEYVERLAAITDTIPTLKTTIVCGGMNDQFAKILSVTSRTPLSPVRDLMNHECLIVYTSGTTGNPKGVLLSHGNLLADARGISQWHQITSDSRMMCVLPIHHVNGTVVTLVTPLYAASSLVLNRKFQSNTFFNRIAAEQVEVVSVVPTLLAFLVQADIDTSVIDLGRFRHIICGAGPLTCELAERFEDRYGFPIMHGYGLSETTCYSCFLPTSLSASQHRMWMQDHGFPSIGVPIPQNEMAIHDTNGNPLVQGERGEIVIRGHNVMLEYYNNEEANRNAFTYGWFRSGDEGFWLKGEDGLPYFFITGRIKELIIRGGVNISPLEIDEIINSHPKVDAGIAVGFENNWYGEEVGAYIRKADESLTEDELLEFCRQHLPFHKTPKVVVFGNDIPVTSTGKYQRNRVKWLFEEHKRTQFQAPDRVRH
jgi:long-chain acyl-CoA synthetase